MNTLIILSLIGLPIIKNHYFYTQLHNMKIRNPWASHAGPQFYFVNKPIFTLGKFSIYKLWGGNYLYTCENTAINQLAGINIEHVKNLHNNTRPEYGAQAFLFDRAMETIKKYNL